MNKLKNFLSLSVIFSLIFTNIFLWNNFVNADNPNNSPNLYFQQNLEENGFSQVFLKWDYFDANNKVAWMQFDVNFNSNNLEFLKIKSGNIFWFKYNKVSDWKIKFVWSKEVSKIWKNFLNFWNWDDFLELDFKQKYENIPDSKISISNIVFWNDIWDNISWVLSKTWSIIDTKNPEIISTNISEKIWENFVTQTWLTLNLNSSWATNYRIFWVWVKTQTWTISSENQDISFEILNWDWYKDFVLQLSDDAWNLSSEKYFSLNLDTKAPKINFWEISSNIWNPEIKFNFYEDDFEKISYKIFSWWTLEENILDQNIFTWSNLSAKINYDSWIFLFTWSKILSDWDYIFEIEVEDFVWNIFSKTWAILINSNLENTTYWEINLDTIPPIISDFSVDTWSFKFWDKINFSWGNISDEWFWFW